MIPPIFEFLVGNKIWVQKWILSRAEIKIIMINDSADFRIFGRKQDLGSKWILSWEQIKIIMIDDSADFRIFDRKQDLGSK